MPQWRAAHQASQEGRDQAEADQGAGGGNARARREDQALSRTRPVGEGNRSQTARSASTTRAGHPTKRGPASVFQAPAARPAPTGRLMVKAAPTPGALSTSTVPPCASTIRRVM